MNRRGFLTAILATCAAPAIVRASSLMPLVVRLSDLSGMSPILSDTSLILFGDGIHDDTRALQALIDGRPVFGPDGMAASYVQMGKRFLLTDTLRYSGPLADRVEIVDSHFQYTGPPDRPMLLWAAPDALLGGWRV